ncbi:MAG: radical SAM protein [Elusimicrobia bacterium]|nr:radical SAM protein [Elusimicrobiota bacterium]
MSLGRVAFVVLGCAKNQVEAESMSSRLARDGWDLTADIPNANLVVVHSCGFLDAARQEARDTLGNVRRASPKASVVLTGCFAQYLNGRRLPGVDAILGTGQFDRLPAVLEGLRRKRSAPPAIPRSGPAGYHDASRPRPLPPGQLSAYVRISEGCNHRCTFCVIPQLRGSLKSRPPEDIFAEARDLTDRGVRAGVDFPGHHRLRPGHGPSVAVFDRGTGVLAEAGLVAPPLRLPVGSRRRVDRAVGRGAEAVGVSGHAVAAHRRPGVESHGPRQRRKRDPTPFGPVGEAGARVGVADDVHRRVSRRDGRRLPPP